MAYPYNGILLGSENNVPVDTFSKVDASWKHYAKWKKSYIKV